MIRSRLFLVFTWSVASGCVDTSPLDYVDEGLDAAVTVVPDAEPVDGTLESTCRRCLTDQDGPCSAPATACSEDARCPSAVDCFFEQRCFLLKAIEDKITCATPCFEKYDLRSATDPTVAILIDLNICSDGACSSACAGP